MSLFPLACTKKCTTPTGRLPLDVLLLRLRPRGAADARDKVFSLLGISQSNIMPCTDPEKLNLIQPDHAISLEALFIRTSRLLRKFCRDLRLFLTKKSLIMTKIKLYPHYC